MTDPELPSIGTVIGQKYRIESVIGEGGMGVVFAAIHEKLGQPVAIKMLLPALARLPELVTRFEREARAAAQLRHRNSARVIDVDETTNGIPYMVMERLHGRDLETELEERGKLDISEAVHFVVEACSAMAEAHSRGIVHRDLKPSNLFLSEEADGTTCIKVLDFGISKVQSDDGRITSTAHQMGTPLYMSPEQVRSAKNVDARTDVWSLGVILYELLTGETPFKGSTAGIGAAIVGDAVPLLRSLRPEIPEAVEAAVAKSMAKSAADRFASMREMIAALAPFSSVPIAAPSDVSRPRMTSITSSPSLVAAETLAAPPPASAHTADPLNDAAAPNATAGSWVKVKSRGESSRRAFWIVGALAAAAAAAAVSVAVLMLSRPPSKTVAAAPLSSENALPIAPSASMAVNSATAPEPPGATAVASTAPSASSAPNRKPHGAATAPAKSAATKPASSKPTTSTENPARL
jgi:serine/threonine protein kinase